MRPLARFTFWISFLAFNGVFFPMHILGVGGHMRRIANPMQYEFLQHMQGINVFITISAPLFWVWLNSCCYSMCSGVFSAGRWLNRIRGKRPRLEWYAPTPVPHGNFGAIPQVYHGPYEYSVPGAETDWTPQTEPNGESPHGEPVPAGATAD